MISVLAIHSWLSARSARHCRDGGGPTLGRLRQSVKPGKHTALQISCFEWPRGAAVQVSSTCSRFSTPSGLTGIGSVATRRSCCRGTTERMSSSW
jgi:hypothetical protein